MKVITCPQCGALVREFSLKDKFAQCEYCKAKILLEDNRDRIVEIPDEKKPYEQFQENYRKLNERVKQYDAPYTYPEDTETPGSKLFTGLVVLGLIALFVVVIFSLLFGSLFQSPAPPRAEKKTFIPTPFPTIETPGAATPLPQINYQVRVQWNGANDMEYFENPQIDSAKLPTTDEAKLKKTVFKNRAVQVKITIGTEGEVTSAEAISGHPILKEAAVNAAKKTLFNSRPKPTTRLLTYYFRLTNE
jgi:hypothetical protein